MGTENETYLKQKLEWVKYRLKALDEIEARLTEMRSIVSIAADGVLDGSIRQELAGRLRMLEMEVYDIDEKTRTFWMDRQ